MERAAFMVCVTRPIAWRVARLRTTRLGGEHPLGAALDGRVGRVQRCAVDAALRPGFTRVRMRWRALVRRQVAWIAARRVAWVVTWIIARRMALFGGVATLVVARALVARRARLAWRRARVVWPAVRPRCRLLRAAALRLARWLAAVVAWLVARLVLWRLAWVGALLSTVLWLIACRARRVGGLRREVRPLRAALLVVRLVVRLVAVSGVVSPVTSRVAAWVVSRLIAVVSPGVVSRVGAGLMPGVVRRARWRLITLHRLRSVWPRPGARVGAAVGRSVVGTCARCEFRRAAL